MCLPPFLSPSLHHHHFLLPIFSFLFSPLYQIFRRERENLKLIQCEFLRVREGEKCLSVYAFSIESYKLCLIHFNKLDTLDYALTKVNDDTVQRMKAIVFLNLVQTHYSKVYIVTIKIGRMIQMMRQRERERQTDREERERVRQRVSEREIQGKQSEIWIKELLPAHFDEIKTLSHTGSLTTAWEPIIFRSCPEWKDF